MNFFSRTFVLAGLALGALLLPAATSAQDYPNRPVTIVVPYPPGASTDFVARLIRDPLAEQLKQSVVIENRPGAGGTTAVAGVAKAAPDGYTLLVTVNAPVTMNSYTQKNFPLDDIKTLAPIARVADIVLVLAVNSSLPVKNVAELIDYAKKNPDQKMSFGSAGIGSAHHLAGEMMKQKTGINMVHVPYRGGGPAIADLVAGHIPISFGTTPAVFPHASAGSIRMLGLVEAKRHPDLPDLPTVAETIPGVVTYSWVGFFAPGGTPAPIIDRLNKIVNDALKKPDIAEKMKQQGTTPVISQPKEFGEQIKTEHAYWGTVIPAIGIKPE